MQLETIIERIEKKTGLRAKLENVPSEAPWYADETNRIYQCFSLRGPTGLKIISLTVVSVDGYDWEIVERFFSRELSFPDMVSE
jgi:hypothetical protein